MRVLVDEDRCAGHGTCCGLCPQVFELTNAGYAATRVSEVPQQYQDVVRKAVDQCPEGAISTTE
jgi:ferredoxin